MKRTNAGNEVGSTAKKFQLIIGILASIGTPVAMIFMFSNFASAAAARFRIYDISGDYLSGVIAAMLLLFIIFLWPIPQSHRVALALLWIVRTGVTLGLMLVFEAAYGVDSPTYYRAGIALNSPLAIFEIGAGTTNTIGIVGIISTITESYSAIKVIFSYIGLISVYVFYRSYVNFYRIDNISMLYVLGLFPSLLLWGSIVGKDPIVLFGLALFCYGATGLIMRQRLSMIVYIGIGLAIASFIRIWLGLIFVSPLIATFVLLSRSSAIVKMIFVLVAVPTFILSFESFLLQFQLQTMADLLTTTQSISRAWSHGGSAQLMTGVQFGSIVSMFKFAPLGAFTALFRPLPFEVSNAFGLVAGIENAAVLFALVVGLLRRGFGWVRHPVLFWAVATIIVWSSIYGFVSYQNLGTAFRFRVQIVPFLVGLALYLNFSHKPSTRKEASLEQSGSAASGENGPPSLL